MALSSRNGDEDPLATAIKDAIAECAEDGDGAPVEAALAEAVDATDYSGVDVEDAFEDLKRRGEVFVFGDNPEHVKVAP
jgi:hypothetical protein